MPVPTITVPTSPRVIAVNKAIPMLSISATNSPTSYAVSTLPPGISMGVSTGQITGTPSAVGMTTTSITATNESGTSLPVYIIWDVRDAAVGAGRWNDLELDFDLVTREVTVPKVEKQAEDVVVTLLTRDAINLLIGFKKWGQLRLLQEENKFVRISFSLKEFEPEQVITLTQAVGTIVGSGDTTRYRIPLSLTREQWNLLSSYEDDNQTSVRAVSSVELTLVPDDGSDPDGGYSQTKTTSIPLIYAGTEPGDITGTLAFTGIDTGVSPMDFTLSMRLVVNGRPNQTIQLSRSFLGRWNGSVWEVSAPTGASLGSGSTELPWKATLQNVSLSGDANSIDVAYQITTDGTPPVGPFQWEFLGYYGGAGSDLQNEQSVIGIGGFTLYLKDANGELVGSYTFPIDTEGPPSFFFASLATAWDTITGTTGQMVAYASSSNQFWITADGDESDEMIVRYVAWHGGGDPISYVTGQELPTFEGASSAVLTTSLTGEPSNDNSVTKTSATFSVDANITAGQRAGTFDFTGLPTDKSPITFDLALSLEVAGRPNHSTILERTFTATWGGYLWIISGATGPSSWTSTEVDPWQLTFTNIDLYGDSNSVEVLYQVTTGGLNSNLREFVVDWGGANTPPFANPSDTANYSGYPLDLSNPTNMIHWGSITQGANYRYLRFYSVAEEEGTSYEYRNVISTNVFATAVVDEGATFYRDSVETFFGKLVGYFAAAGYTVTIEVRSATSFAIIYDITQVPIDPLDQVAEIVFCNGTSAQDDPWPQGYIESSLPDTASDAVVRATLVGDYTLERPTPPALRLASQPFFTRVVRDWLNDYDLPTPTPTPTPTPPPTPTPTPTPTPPPPVYSFNFTESRVNPDTACSAYPIGAANYYSNVETLAVGSLLYADVGLTTIANSIPGEISYFSSGFTYWTTSPTGQVTHIGACPAAPTPTPSPTPTPTLYTCEDAGFSTDQTNSGTTTVPIPPGYLNSGDGNETLTCWIPDPVPTPSPSPTQSYWSCTLLAPPLSDDDLGYGSTNVIAPAGYINSGANVTCYYYPP